MPSLQGTTGISPFIMVPGQVGATVNLSLTNTTNTPAIVQSICQFLSGNGAGSAPINLGSVPNLNFQNGLSTSILPGQTINLAWGIAPYGTSNRYVGGSPGTGVNTNNTDTNPGDVQSYTYSLGIAVQTTDGVVSQISPANLQLVYNPNNVPVFNQLVFNSIVASEYIPVLL